MPDGLKTSVAVFLKDYTGPIAILLGVTTTIGFSINTPWPARAEVEKLQNEYQSLQTQIEAQNCMILRVLLKGYEDDLEAVETKLQTDPANASLKRQRDNDQAQIAAIRQQMTAQRCPL
jgi:t-SNARE complex subunit (syntaxin)